jgi:hypothetical protein
MNRVPVILFFWLEDDAMNRVPVILFFWLEDDAMNRVPLNMTELVHGESVGSTTLLP